MVTEMPYMNHAIFHMAVQSHIYSNKYEIMKQQQIQFVHLFENPHRGLQSV